MKEEADLLESIQAEAQRGELSRRLWASGDGGKEAGKTGFWRQAAKTVLTLPRQESDISSYIYGKIQEF